MVKKENVTMSKVNMYVQSDNSTHTDSLTCKGELHVMPLV